MNALLAVAVGEEADRGGTGSLNIAMDDASDLKGAWGSYRLGLPFVGRFRVLISRYCSRGIKPGSTNITPAIRMEISVFHKPSGA